MRLAPHPMTLRQLQYIVSVAELRSFRRAAEACHVSQPALSAQIAQVEQALGVALFERDNRRVLVTAAGDEFLTRARALLLAADDLVTTAQRHADPFAGELTLGVIPTIAPYLLPHLVPVLREKFPKLSVYWVEARTEELVRKLDAAELDGALVALESELGDRAWVELGADPFVFAAAPTHPLARGARSIKRDELEGEDVLVLDDGHCFRDQVLKFCASAHAEEGAFRATSLATLSQMVAGGLGVTLLPTLALDVENRAASLKVRSIAPEPPTRTLALAWRRSSPLEVVLRPVGEAMRAAYARLPGQRNRRSDR